jgi:hypothetical protein
VLDTVPQAEAELRDWEAAALEEATRVAEAEAQMLPEAVAERESTEAVEL